MDTRTHLGGLTQLGFTGRRHGGAGGGGGGGPVLDNSIAAPTLSLAVAANVYPPQLDIALPVDVQAGVHSIRIWADDDYLFGSPFINDLLSISDAEAAAATKLDSNLGAISSPAITFFRARIEWTVSGVTHYTNWSNTQGHGDVVAPSMTSSTSASGAELAAMSFPITANEVCSYTLAGVDAGALEIASATPSASNTVRLSANALLNFEAKASYSFTVTPTDLSGNVGSAQTCTFTVTDVDEVPNANPFTAVGSATISTLYTSNVGTVSGLATGISVPVTFSGSGQYRKNGGAWTTAASTATNGDTFEVQLTSSALGSTAVTGTVNIGDPATAWSFTVTTVSEFGFLFVAGDIGYAWDTTDLTRMFQDVSGATGAAFGSVVGKINDISGQNNPLLSVGNDNSRPTLQNVSNGLLSFDGVNDHLRNIGGFYAKTAMTMIIVVKDTQANANNANMFWAETNTGTSSPVYAPGTRQNANQDVLNFLRNDANTTVRVANMDVNCWDGTAKILTIIEVGGVVKVSVNGGAFVTSSVARSGAFTGNLSCLGVAENGGTSSLFGPYAGSLGSGVIVSKDLNSANLGTAGTDITVAYNKIATKHGLPTL